MMFISFQVKHTLPLFLAISLVFFHLFLLLILISRLIPWRHHFLLFQALFFQVLLLQVLFQVRLFFQLVLNPTLLLIVLISLNHRALASSSPAEQHKHRIRLTHSNRHLETKSGASMASARPLPPCKQPLTLATRPSARTRCLTLAPRASTASLAPRIPCPAPQRPRTSGSPRRATRRSRRAPLAMDR